MPSITIKRGGPTNDIENGVYPMTLAGVNGPKTIFPPTAPDGTNIFEWDFTLADGRPIQGTSSTFSGPKSKLYQWVTALRGGKPPEVDEEIELDSLVGRSVLGTIDHNEGGWPRLAQLTAIPASMLQQGFAAATGAPTRGTPVTTRPAANARPAATRAAAPLNLQPATQAGDGDELPF